MVRVPTAADFAGLAPDLHVALHFPDPPASTTAILLLFHGLGDSETPFAGFAKAMNLPGVLAVSVRGPGVVPASFLGDAPGQHFHWADDLALRGADLDPDPDMDRALRLVADRLIGDVLLRRCGWRADDLVLFGFGQGGTLALALAARVARTAQMPLKGVVTIGADVPSSVAMAATPATPAADKTPLLLCGAADSEATADETAALLRKRFDVQTVRWPRPADDNGMPRNRAEMLPIMQFLLPKLTRW